MLDITVLAAWGEFLGGIAVVASLIYLASQIRQNSRLLRASTATSAWQASITSLLEMVRDPEVDLIWTQGVRDPASLSNSQRSRFNTLTGISVQAAQLQFRFVESSLIVEGDSNLRAFRWLFKQPGMRPWWREFRHLYDDSFAEFVDGLIREGEAAE